jgi:hypothetical protein
MEIDLVPLLKLERRLYETERGMERFRRYVEVATGGGKDMELPPLAVLNPMGKEHVAAALDALIAIDADAIAAAAVAEAYRRLAGVSGSLLVGLVIVDDVAGGWTNRYLTEARQRLEGDAEVKRGWASVLLWASEPPDPERVRQETLAAVFRSSYIRDHGLPRTLRQMMLQEGLAGAFGDVKPPIADRGRLAQIRQVIDPQRDTTDYPTAFACLYGDEAAVEVGYPPLDLPARAGFALAIHEALRRRQPPEAALGS